MMPPPRYVTHPENDDKGDAPKPDALELLEALKQLTIACRAGAVTPDHIRRARAAIARAEGR